MWNNSGSTIWARQTTESEIFCQKPAEWFKIWFYIINKVNWKDIKQFKRGEQFFTFKEIAYCTKTTKNQVEKFTKWARGASMITTRKTTRGIIIFVVNYNKFQDSIKIKSVTESDTRSELEAEQKRDRSATIIETYKQDKHKEDIYQKNLTFFNDPLVREEIIQELIQKNGNERIIRSEINRFCDTWTEANQKNGKQDRKSVV